MGIILKKMISLVSGILLAECATRLLLSLVAAGNTPDQWRLPAFVIALIVFIVTTSDRKYKYLPEWKRFLRFIWLAWILLLILTAGEKTLGLFPEIPAGHLATFLDLFPTDNSGGIRLPLWNRTLQHLEATGVLVVLILVSIALYIWLFRPLANISRKKLNEMEGHEFESFCAQILQKNGYRHVEVTQGSSDYGADILARKRGRKCVIQCKRYTTPVGSNPVQEVVAARKYYDAKKAVVMTNSTFTPNAKRLAKANKVTLIDGDDLMRMRR